MAKSKVYYTDMHVTGERNLLQKLEALMKKAGFENIDFKDHRDLHSFPTRRSSDLLL